MASTSRAGWDRTPWKEPKEDHSGGNGGGTAARTASALERLSIVIEHWLNQPGTHGQQPLIDRNIRVLAAQHPTLARVFRISN